MNRELYPYQVHAVNDVFHALRPAEQGGLGKRRVALQLATGGGKCLGIGTKVMKFDGSIVTVEKIETGDFLMGPDGTRRRVLSTCYGIGRLFRIVPTRGDPWVCNDVHVLTLVETVSGNIVDVPLDEYMYKNKTFKHTHKQFSPEEGIDFYSLELDPEVPPYFLGLWIGDGTKALRGVAISKPDREVAEECERIAVANGGYVRTEYATSGGCPTYHIATPRGHPNRLLSKMRELMAGGEIPMCVRTASREYRAEVIAGVVDTDGFVYNNSCEVVQKSVKIADGIAFLARSLGLKVTCADKVVNGTVYKRMGISGDLSKIPTRIVRKTCSQRRQKKIATRTGFSVQSIGIGEYAGFELDGDGRFLLGDFTVTHNTVLSAAIIERGLSRGRRMMFTVPALSLVDQTVERFWEEGIRDVGVIQADHPMTAPDRPVQVASVQTLARRTVPEFALIIQDEAHRMFDTINQLMIDRPATPFVGLSATPWTKGLGKPGLYEHLVVAATTEQLIASGHLCPFRVLAPAYPDLDGVKTVAGDYHEGQLSGAMQGGTLMADTVQTWLDKGDRRPTLCFCVDRAHAKAMQERFQAAGVPTGYIDANTSVDERRTIRQAFRDREIEVVCNIGVLTTGVDWPEISCIILARPTKSEMLFCLDSETEILTSYGWKGIGEIKVGDCIASCDGADPKFGCWSNVTGVVERDMNQDESWVEYHAPRANFRVTDRHRMIFRGQSEKGGYRIDEARIMTAVKGSVIIPTAVSIPQSGVPLTDDELYFIGMMMADGTWTSIAGSISQSDRHPDVVTRIEKCLVGCGIGYAKRRVMPSANPSDMIERNPRWVFSFSAGKPKPHKRLGTAAFGNECNGGYEFIPGVTGYRHLLPYLDKDFATALFQMSKAQALKLISGLWDGDGAKKLGVDYTPRSLEICSSRKQMVDRLQAICAINGLTANVRCENGASRSSPIWLITITDKDWRSCGGYASANRNPRPQIEMKPATTEKVWCVESKSGTIVTRRKGKVTVMGNCQIIGRGLRTCEGKDYLLILDHAGIHNHPDEKRRLGCVTDIHHEELDDGKERQKAERNPPMMKPCPACQVLKPPRTPVCPHCGFHARPTSHVDEDDGELVEFRSGGNSFAYRKGAVPDDPNMNLYAQLLGYAAEKGYKSAWAKHKYREFLGTDPPKQRPDPIEPTRKTRSRIRASMRAWMEERRSVESAAQPQLDLTDGML